MATRNRPVSKYGPVRNGFSILQHNMYVGGYDKLVIDIFGFVNRIALRMHCWEWEGWRMDYRENIWVMVFNVCMCYNTQYNNVENGVTTTNFLLYLLKSNIHF